MRYELKRAIISSVTMIFLCAFFILGLEIYQRPDGEGMAENLSRLEEYTGGDFVSKLPAAYYELSSLEPQGLYVYKVEGTAKEFAVVAFDDMAHQGVVGVFQTRLSELAAEFAQNPEELKRIDDARIITINQYAVMAVCDSEDTAENAIYQYFGMY